jgi:hypothetical protein
LAWSLAGRAALMNMDEKVVKEFKLKLTAEKQSAKAAMLRKLREMEKDDRQPESR